MIAAIPYGTRQKPASPAHSLRAVEQRLENAERELQLQFERIAQLQAALDLLLAGLRRRRGRRQAPLSCADGTPQTLLSSRRIP